MVLVLVRRLGNGLLGEEEGDEGAILHVSANAQFEMGYTVVQCNAARTWYAILSAVASCPAGSRVGFGLVWPGLVLEQTDWRSWSICRVEGAKRSKQQFEFRG